MSAAGKAAPPPRSPPSQPPPGARVRSAARSHCGSEGARAERTCPGGAARSPARVPVCHAGLGPGDTGFGPARPASVRPDPAYNTRPSADRAAPPLPGCGVGGRVERGAGWGGDRDSGRRWGSLGPWEDRRRSHVSTEARLGLGDTGGHPRRVASLQQACAGERGDPHRSHHEADAAGQTEEDGAAHPALVLDLESPRDFWSCCYFKHT